MRRRTRLGIFVAVIAIAVAAPAAYASSTRVARVDDGRATTVHGASAHGDHAAVVHAVASRRIGRTHGVDVPVRLLAALSATVLGAYWFALGSRRRDRRLLQFVAFRRRGPPSLQFVM